MYAIRSYYVDLIKEDILDLMEKYGDERRTEIAFGLDAELNMEDLIQDEDVLISITQRGYIKRTPVSAYRIQHRGGNVITSYSIHYTKLYDRINFEVQHGLFAA